MKKTLNNKEKIEYEYLIKLLASCVNKTEVPLPYSNIDWDMLYKRANYCRVDSMFANAVLKLPQQYQPTGELLLKIKELKNAAILVDSVHLFEIEKVLKAFEKGNIVNMPLKGYFMKNEYPQSDFRSISDFDILFDMSDFEKVKQAFNELGYNFIHSDDNQHHFQKKPYMYIEMHSSLVHEWEHYYPYLKNSLNRGLMRNNYEYSRKMRTEDYYAFMLVHNSTHYRIGGMGIRMVLDIYLYYKNHQNEFDFDYLDKILCDYKLKTFEERIRKIALNWFAEPLPKMSFDDVESYILLSNALGRSDVGNMINVEKSIINAEKAGKKKTKFSFLISSIFPPLKYMKINFMYLNRLPFLLPFSWLQMWFVRVFIKRDVRFKSGFKSKMNYTENDLDYFKKVISEVGFDDLDRK